MVASRSAVLCQCQQQPALLCTIVRQYVCRLTSTAHVLGFGRKQGAREKLCCVDALAPQSVLTRFCPWLLCVPLPS